jgi:hypothetical protein
MPERLKPKSIAASLTGVACLIIITPLCGLLFHCHCKWPWMGFYFGCNYYQPQVIHKCPWCSSLFSGWFSIGLAFVSALLSAILIKTSPSATTTKAISVRLLSALAVFILVAAICGMIAAYAQDYPLCISNATL